MDKAVNRPQSISRVSGQNDTIHNEISRNDLKRNGSRRIGDKSKHNSMRNKYKYGFLSQFESSHKSPSRIKSRKKIEGKKTKRTVALRIITNTEIPIETITHPFP